MQTPKERFLVSGHAVNFSKVVATESFEFACDYALLQLQSEMPTNIQPGLPTDGLVGFDANARIQGALRVLEILKHISEPVKQAEPQRKDKLHY